MCPGRGHNCRTMRLQRRTVVHTDTTHTHIIIYKDEVKDEWWTTWNGRQSALKLVDDVHPGVHNDICKSERERERDTLILSANTYTYDLRLLPD